MNCRRAKKQILQFLDGLADEREQIKLEQHLAECAKCDRLSQELTRSLDLVHRTPMETVDENFAWKVRLAIGREKEEMQHRSSGHGALFRAWNLRYAASAAAGMVAVVAVGLLMWRAGDPVVPPVVSSGVTARPAGSTTPRATLPPNTRAATGGQLVSLGNGATRGPSTRIPGAIDVPARSAELDSIMRERLSGLDTEGRVEYLQELSVLLDSYLQRYAANPHR